MLRNCTTFLLFAAALFVFAEKVEAQYCTNDARYTEVAIFTQPQITVGANIQYGIAQDHMGNPDTLLMDIYYPNNSLDTAMQRPFVLLFHGGGFVSGDKQSGDIRDLCFHLAMRGFVCASVNYRLGFDFSEYGQFKARYRAIQDGHAAMRYIVQNASTVRVDTNWLFVGGQSAGALLALGMVYADVDEIDSIALLYGTTTVSSELGGLYTSGNNLTNSYSIRAIFNNWGGVSANEMDGDEMLPTVAFHGALDTTVRIDADNSFAHYTLNGSRAIHDVLTANSICSEITVDTLGGHGIFRNASSVFRAQRASCFFKSVFCANCASLSTTDSIAPTCSMPIAIAEYDSPSALKIYPNPFQNSFFIEGANGSVDCAIFSSTGQLLHREESLDGHIRADLPRGVYFLRIIANGRTQTQVLRKE